jgi:uncharacterized RmlC-like cupin family protein
MTEVDMNAQIARFKDLQPTKKSFSKGDIGIPEEAFQIVTAHALYRLMAPAENARKSAKPAVAGEPGLEVVIAVCPPGQGPGLHNHQKTQEIFICITGRYEVIWGDKGEHSTILDPCDMVAVPPGIYRRFRNASDVEDAKLLVIVQGSAEHAFNDIEMDKNLGDEVERRWGNDVRKNFQKVGIHF